MSLNRDIRWRPRRPAALARLPGACVIVLAVLFAFAGRLGAAGSKEARSVDAKRPVPSNVTLQVTNRQLLITGRNVNLCLDWPSPPMDYLCAVRNPFAQPKLRDGLVVKDANFQVLEDDHKLKLAALPRFAFFTNRPTTFGLMTGHAAANGDSQQTLYLVDVESGRHLVIPLVDGNMPQWLDRNAFPPPFITRYGPGCKGWYRPCVGQAYHFVNGRYERDVATEQQFLAREFRKTRVTPGQRRELASADEWVLDDGQSPQQTAQALGDFVYYATLTGHATEWAELQMTLKPGLRKTLNALRDQIYAQSRTNAVAGMVAPVPVPLGDGLTPPDRENLVYVVRSGDTLASVAGRFGLTIKALLAGNPEAKRGLKVGQKLVIGPPP